MSNYGHSSANAGAVSDRDQIWKRCLENHVLADEYILPEVDPPSAVQHNSQCLGARKRHCQKLKTSVYQTPQQWLYHLLTLLLGKQFNFASANNRRPPEAFAASASFPNPSR